MSHPTLIGLAGGGIAELCDPDVVRRAFEPLYTSTLISQFLKSITAENLTFSLNCLEILVLSPFGFRSG